MCGCAVNLSSGRTYGSSSRQFTISNTPEALVKFVIDNNPAQVFANLEKAGIPTARMSNADAVSFLVSSHANGWDISNIVNVPYKNNADNYTGGLIDQFTEFKPFAETYTGQLLSTILGGLAAGVGTSIFMGSGGAGSAPPPAPIEEPIYNKPIFWVGILGALVLVVFLIKR